MIGVIQLRQHTHSCTLLNMESLNHSYRLPENERLDIAIIHLKSLMLDGLWIVENIKYDHEPRLPGKNVWAEWFVEHVGTDGLHLFDSRIPVDGSNTSHMLHASTPKSLPKFEHPSHSLLKEKGFTQQVYGRFRTKCFKGMILMPQYPWLKTYTS